MASQGDLFAGGRELPEGFRYAPELIPPPEETVLLERLRDLPLQAFDFHGYIARRRVLSFGWRYDFGDRSLQRVEPIPEFIQPVRSAAAGFAGFEPAELEQVLVTEYAPGAAIGWHRDKAVFGDVVGVSLLAPCQFRLRCKDGTKWQRLTLTAEPRSAYLLSGPARTEWEHSIPPVAALRYSITFRTLLRPPAP